MLLEDLAAEPIELAPGDARLDRATARSSASRQSRWYSTQLVATARRRRTCASCRRSSRSRGRAGRGRGTTGSPGGSGRSPCRGRSRVCGAVRDDELVGERAVRGERLLDRELDALARQRLAVEHEPRRSRLGAPQQVARRVIAGLGSASARAGCRPSRPSFFTRRRSAKSSRSAVSSIPFARRWSASSSGKVAGTAALARSRARGTARSDDLELDLVARRAPARELVDRRSSSSGMTSSSGATSAIRLDLERARDHVPRARRARRRGTGPAPRPAPRAASPASESMIVRRCRTGLATASRATRLPCVDSLDADGRRARTGAGADRRLRRGAARASCPAAPRSSTPTCTSATTSTA